MRRALVLSLVVFALALAGCIGAQEGDPVEQASDEEEPVGLLWPEKALGDGHDHTDLEAHENLSTANFETVGHAPLETREGTAPGGSSCADAAPAPDERRLGVQKGGDSRAAVVSDLSDPTAPEHVGELWLTFTHIYDVAAAPDGEHVVLVTSQPKEGPAPEPALEDEPIGYWTDGCTGETVALESAQDPLPRPTSLILVHVPKEGAPEVEDHRALTGLGHSAYADDVDGEVWVAGVTDSIAPATRHYHLNRIVDAPEGHALEPMSVYVAKPDPDHVGYVGGHSDMWIQEHPETGQRLAYLSAGPQIEIVDVSNPNAPTRVSSWTDIGPEDPGNHNLHSLHPLDELRDGRHFTIVGPELGSPYPDLPTGIVWVLDTTDPTQPEPVAAWTFPANVTWEGRLQFSTHYLDVVDDTMFITTYHGGVWAVDLSRVPEGTPEDPVRLDSTGVYVPAKQAPLPDPAYDYSWTPNVEDVNALEDGKGTLATFDGNTGVYTFRFDESVEVPTPEPWSFDPVEHLAG